MTARSSFFRKIAYLIAIGVMLVFLYLFGHPATRGGANDKGSPGGFLAQIREDPKTGFSQSKLGNIDPTSEAVKLATFGLRGVAALVLWEKANDYKMKEDWPKYEATLNQITVVQPHLISVWIHLAWNLSYNVSVEFDNYRDRYHWVIEGIKYLQKGISNNTNDPRLLWETGWTVSQKIGRADEHIEYRKLYRNDDEYHNFSPRIDEYRDNWLVGKKSYDRCIDVAKETGKRVKGKGPLIYYSSPSMCLMNYAEALEEEGTFGEKAKRAWQMASKAWFNFGLTKIPEPDNDQLYLGHLEKFDSLEKEFEKNLNDLEPGLKEKIRQKKHDALNKEQLEALDIPVEKRTETQHQLVAQATALMEVTYEEIANSQMMPIEKRSKAKEYAGEARKNGTIATDIRRSRDIVNFNYWKLRAEVEQEDDTTAAREAIYQGTRKFRREADLLRARDLFHDGFGKWRTVLDKHPDLIEDSLTGDDIMDEIKVYRELLNKIDEPFPKPFILQDIIDKYDKK